MANGKVGLADLNAVSEETATINKLIQAMDKVQRMIDTTGVGQDKRDFLSGSEFRELVYNCNGDELAAMMSPLIPAIKRRVVERAEIMSRVFGVNIDIPA